MTAPHRDRSRSIRIHVHLRGADLALSEQMGPAEVWYFIRHTDLPGQSTLPAWCIHVNVFSAIWRIFTTRARSIEIPEPLWARFLPTALILMVSARVARLVTGRPARTVFYALENNMPADALFGNAPVPRIVKESFIWLLGAIVTPLVDRVAFGSDGARRAYEHMGRLRLPNTRVFTELPARTLSSDEEETPRVHDQDALFVGGLEYRKGISILLDAWTKVEAELPMATITIIGSGPLRPDVEDWVRRRPERRRYLGQVPHEELASFYEAADVLIAPSVRDGRWREQIGLQLREALAAGVTIVASDETGLADWLREHGHTVVPTADLGESLGTRVVTTMGQLLPRAAVRESLPTVDGRSAADSWLHE